MSIRLSIIIPVYNVAPYLRQCLQSLLQQGLDDYEVILVNDASHDNSRGICSEWCSEHPTFRLLNNSQNMGLSATRNRGIDEARGELLTFVDSDDFLADGTLKAATEAMESDVDAVVYPVMENHLTKNASLWKPGEARLDFARWMREDGFRHCYAVNKVYRRTLWQGIRFPENQFYCEDMVTIPLVMQKARQIRCIDTGIYYYCRRNGSITSQLNKEKLRNYVEALLTIMKFPESASDIELYIAARNAEISYHRMGGTEQMVARQTIPWRYILSSGLTLRQRAKALYLKFK